MLHHRNSNIFRKTKKVYSHLELSAKKITTQVTPSVLFPKIVIRCALGVANISRTFGRFRILVFEMFL
jgi:hypothetical protein